MTESKDKGRIVIWRKIEDSWQWQNPTYRGAWLWMLLKAAYKPHNGLKRGQLYFSVQWGPRVFGLSPTATKRFFRRCEKEGDILWQRGRGGWNTPEDCSKISGPQDGHEDAPQDGPQLGIITILNYDKYNMPRSYGGPQDGPQSEHQGGHFLETKYKKQSKEQKEEEPCSVPEPSDKKRRSPALKDPEKLKEALSAINITALIREWEPKGVDAAAVYDDFCDRVIGDQNPQNYRDFKRALNRWLRNAQKWGKNKPKPRSIFQDEG